jgi:NADH-quinone oxidoreductase subunit G
MDAHRSCTKCTGNVRLWYQGDKILRVTARKDEYGEVVEWICNDCRYHHKSSSDWTIEGPAKINRHSVISANHYLNEMKRDITLHKALLNGVKPQLGEGPLNPNNL